jgi:hypothetical protein
MANDKCTSFKAGYYADSNGSIYYVDNHYITGLFYLENQYNLSDRILTPHIDDYTFLGTCWSDKDVQHMASKIIAQQSKV